jgi:hypothetical protein
MEQGLGPTCRINKKLKYILKRGHLLPPPTPVNPPTAGVVATLPTAVAAATPHPTPPPQHSRPPPLPQHPARHRIGTSSSTISGDLPYRIRSSSRPSASWRGWLCEQEKAAAVLGLKHLNRPRAGAQAGATEPRRWRNSDEQLLPV